MNKTMDVKIPLLPTDQFSLAFLNKNIPSRGTVLAADIGGTKTNLALFKIYDGYLNLITETSYKTKAYNSFENLLREFEAQETSEIDAICLGIAGPVIEGVVQGTNFPWVIDQKKLSKNLKIPSVHVINDLEANAYGLASLKPDEFITLIEGKNIPGNAAIIAPGTGLGEAGMYWDGETYHPFASEGGHCSFSPHNRLDLEIFSFMLQKYGAVSWERIISGQGIIDIHECLRELRNIPVPDWFKDKFDQENRAAFITKTAIEEKDIICEETLALFFRYLAIETSQLGLKMKATGGIYIGGGIVPKIIKGLDKAAFENNFLNSGVMKSLLKTIPVKVILNEKSPLFGAALYAAMGIDVDAK